MTRFALQPRWLAWHLLLVLVLVSFGWLGRWQLGSFEHKEAARPGAGPAVALDRLSRPGGRLPDASVGRRVTATGTYDPRYSALVPDRPEPGGRRRGYLAVAALRTADGVLPVVRGWVPSPSAPPLAVPTGPVRVTGLLQRSEAGPPPGAPSVVPRGELPYVATVTLLDATPLRAAELYDGYLALRTEASRSGAVRPATLPVPVAAQPASTGGVSRWRNLAYALQWWLFAGAAVFFWWSVLSRAEREARAPDPRTGAGRPPLAAPRRTT